MSLRGKASRPARGYTGKDKVYETLEFANARDKRRKANKLARKARKKNR